MFLSIAPHPPRSPGHLLSIFLTLLLLAFFLPILPDVLDTLLLHALLVVGLHPPPPCYAPLPHPSRLHLLPASHPVAAIPSSTPLLRACLLSMHPLCHPPPPLLLVASPPPPRCALPSHPPFLRLLPIALLLDFASSPPPYPPWPFSESHQCLRHPPPPCTPHSRPPPSSCGCSRPTAWLPHYRFLIPHMLYASPLQAASSSASFARPDPITTDFPKPNHITATALLTSAYGPPRPLGSLRCSRTDEKDEEDEEEEEDEEPTHKEGRGNGHLYSNYPS